MNRPADYVQFLETRKELNRPPAQRGFSLLEVLIALSLAGCIMLTLAQIFLASATTAALARSKETAVLAAQDKLEQLSAVYLNDFTHPDLASGSHGPEEYRVVDPTDGKILDCFSISWNVGRIRDPRPDHSPKGIEVTVAAVPVLNDGAPIRSPYFKRRVVLSMILGPER